VAMLRNLMPTTSPKSVLPPRTVWLSSYIPADSVQQTALRIESRMYVAILA
jgi:hypothetical protein